MEGRSKRWTSRRAICTGHPALSCVSSRHSASKGGHEGATLIPETFCPSTPATARSASQRQSPPDEGARGTRSEGGEHALVTRPG